MKKLRFVNPGELPERIDRAGESYPAGPSFVLPLPTGQALSRLSRGAPGQPAEILSRPAVVKVCFGTFNA